MHRPTRRTHLATALMALFLALSAFRASAQEFSVTAFRTLPNDVSAFISPVRDLNGDACALLKVIAPAEFAFSTPLGIVMRRDEVGEIWLYLPAGSKKITIKHPRWGVLRDYRFASPLESHVTYEMTIGTPTEATAVERDTVILTKTITDTITVGTHKPRLPLSADVLLTAAFHANGPSWGIMATLMRRHGAFAHISTDLRSTGDTRTECDEQGYVDMSGALPYYTGLTRHSSFTVTFGPVHRLCRWLNLFHGIGYGRNATAWQLDDSEGGGWALNRGFTHKGIAAEAGALLRIGRVSLSASAITIGGKHWQGSLGIGVNLGKR